MTTVYKQIDADTIQFFTTNKDNSVTNGSIVNGRLRTRLLDDDTSEEYSPWDELMLTNPTIEAIPQSQLDAEALDEFKANRQKLIDSAVVNANGFSFDADEISIGRLASAVLAAITEDDTFVMQWSLADTDTGVMTDVTLADLKLAHKLSVLNMSRAWGI